MNGVTKQQMLIYRDQAIQALNAVMTTGESYEITQPDGSKQRVTRANVKDIQSTIDYWHYQIMQLEGRGGPVYVRPTF